MPEIKSQKNYMSKLGKKGKMSNQSSGKSGKLTKDGLIYRNDLLDTDYTSQDMGTVRKLKGVR